MLPQFLIHGVAALLALPALMAGGATDAPNYSDPEPLRVERVWTVTHESGGVTSLGAAVVTPDGGVVAADPLGFAIVAIGPSGAVRWRAGRRGDGPGEFGQRLGQVLFPPEARPGAGAAEVVAVEHNPPRSHAFDLTTGEHLRTESFLDMPGLQPPWRPSGPSAILDDASVLTVPSALPRYRVETGAGESVLLWNQRTGAIDTIVTVATSWQYLTVRMPGDMLAHRGQRFGDGNRF